MTLRIAVQMDPLESINIAGDSTFYLMLAAQERGYPLWHYDVKSLALDTHGDTHADCDPNANANPNAVADALTVIPTVVAPETWKKNRGAKIQKLGQTLVVRQTRPVHRRIDQFLTAYSSIDASPKPIAPESNSK